MKIIIFTGIMEGRGGYPLPPTRGMPLKWIFWNLYCVAIRNCHNFRNWFSCIRVFIKFD